jgi:hypothetical protein
LWKGGAGPDLVKAVVYDNISHYSSSEISENSSEDDIAAVGVLDIYVGVRIISCVFLPNFINLKFRTHLFVVNRESKLYC